MGTVRRIAAGKFYLVRLLEGLLAISYGLSANFRDDHEMLKHGMVIYDALYTWCRLQSEKHSK